MLGEAVAGGRLWDHRDITRLSEPSPCTQRSDSTSSHIGCWGGPSRCARAHKALSACARAVWSASCERHRRAFHVQQCGLGRGEHAAGNALRTLLHPASAADSRGRCSSSRHKSGAPSPHLALISGTPDEDGVSDRCTSSRELMGNSAHNGNYEKVKLTQDSFLIYIPKFHYGKNRIWS